MAVLDATTKAIAAATMQSGFIIAPRRKILIELSSVRLCPLSTKASVILPLASDL